jgi:hypothetical protein
MPYTFQATHGFAHYTPVSGLSNGNTYTYYVKCIGTMGLSYNLDSYIISFAVASSNSSYSRADTNQDGCVDSTELLAFIDRWKVNNQDVTLREIIEAIGLWKRGCPG